MSLLLISGCVSAHNIGKSELAVEKTVFFHVGNGKPTPVSPTVERWADYAGGLAVSYMRLSDRSSAQQDMLAGGLIASAATAAGGIVYGANGDLIKGAALAAGSIGVVDTYLKPGATTVALLVASKKMNCVQHAGLWAANGGLNEDDNAISMIAAAMTKIQTALRLEVKRDLQSYQDLLKSILSVQPKEEKDTKSLANFAEIEALENKLNNCVDTGNIVP